jgi:cytochrome c biogenesis protein CcdA
MLSLSLAITLLSLAIADCLNPTLFAIQIYLLTTVNPSRRAIAFAMGVYTSALLGSLVLVFGLWHWILIGLKAIGSWAVLLQCLLGLLLLALGLLPHKLFHSQPQSTQSTGITAAYWTGFMAVAGDISVFPFLVATEQMAAAKLPGWQSVMILIIYNFIYASPLVIMALFARKFGQRKIQRLIQFNAWISRYLPWLLRGFVAIVGFILIFTAIAR